MQTPRSRPQLAYWVCQSAFWLAFALLCTISSWITEGQVIGYLLSNIVLAAGGVLVTHLFRGFILTRGWLGLAPGSLVVRVVAAITVLSLLHVGLTYLESPVECYLVKRNGSFDFINQHLVYLLFDFLFGFLTFGFWASIYLGFHFLQDRRRAEKESWRLAAELSRSVGVSGETCGGRNR